MLSLHSKHLNASYHRESEENAPAKLQAKFEKLHAMNWDGPSCLAALKHTGGGSRYSCHSLLQESSPMFLNQIPS